MLDIATTHGLSSHLLLAEDHPVNQLVATAMLENLGYRVDVVADGAEVVHSASLTPYRAILMDLQIPVLDGYQATGEIRRSEGTSRRTPIIAITASDAQANRERCMAAGMDDYLTKPLNLETLAAVLSRWAPRGSDPHTVMSRAKSHTEIRSLVSVAEPARPALDPQIVGRLERLGKTAGEDLIGQLARIFLAEADAWVLALRRALDAHDAAAVARSAHLLRGASANLGATDLARSCEALATDVATGDPVGSDALVDAVEAELGRVRSALASRVPSR
jgi:two-component system, sensor histidine kinase and response regulator